MMTQIRTELYKIRTYKKVLRTLLVFTLVSLVVLTLVFAFFDKLMLMNPEDTVTNPRVSFSRALTEPFALPLGMVFMLIAAVSFLYIDFSNGYVKNVAGQIRSKDSYVIAKLIAVSVNNLFFMLSGSLTVIIAGLATGRFDVGDQILEGAATFLIKWLLSIALCAILMLLAVGFRSKTPAIVLAVVFGSGALTLIYLGINAGIAELFKTKSFDIKHYVPSALFDSVDVAKGTLVANALIVAAAVIVLFTILTCAVFKKRDIH